MNHLEYAIFKFNLKDEGERDVFALNRLLGAAHFPTYLFHAEARFGHPSSLSLWVSGDAIKRMRMDYIEDYLLEVVQSSGYVVED